MFLVLSVSACGSNDESYVFKTSIHGNPYTLDPQTALYDSSVSVISNVFQGLFTQDENGNVVNGMIESYSVSDDGFVWTFNLKKDIRWSDGDEFIAECTAEDYVFAFQRLIKPKTKSKRAEEYYIIKNAEALNKGIISDLSALGVKASDKYTLEITLEKPCNDFSQLLALPPAMPCNKEFFNKTQGRYGLSADCVASNSYYYVHTWSYDEWSNENNYFILRRNKENYTDLNIPVSINFFIDPVNELKLFRENTFNAYIAKNQEEISDLKNEFSFSEHDSVWGIIFNLDGYFNNLYYRSELASNTVFVPESEFYTAFSGILPYYKNAEIEYNTSGSDVGKISSTKIIMPTGTGLRGSISKITQNWQSQCNFYCGISELEYDEYISSLVAGDFDIAVVKISPEYNSPYAYLDDFIDGNSKNYSGYSSEKFVHIMNSAFTAIDKNIADKYYREAEQLLIESAVFIPLCIETEYVFYSEGMENIKYNPFSDVYNYIKTTPND